MKLSHIISRHDKAVHWLNILLFSTKDIYNVYVHLVNKVIMSKNMMVKLNRLWAKYDPISDTYQSVNDRSKFLHDWHLVQLRNYNS